MAFGVTPTGFVKRPIEDIKLQLETDLIGEISPSLDVSSTSPIGQIIGGFLKPIGEVWDLLQAVYTANDPDKNTGDAQDAIAAITGTTRLAATHSQAKSVSCTLTTGTVLTVGSLVAVLGNPNAQFRFRGAEPAPGVAVVEANFTAPSNGTFAMRFEAVDTGPIAANAGTLTVIVTPIAGWSAVTNPTDAVLGHNIETASALRLRREAELAALGSTPLDALRAELLELLDTNGVAGSVSVFENVLDTVDVDGRPGHSIEAILNDGGAIANNAIAQAIWTGRGGGINTFGSASGSAVGKDLIVRTMNFNRPTLVPIYFAVTVVTDPTLFPVDGAVQIQEAVVAYGSAGRETGEDVIQNSFFGPIWSIPGVTQVTVLHQGTAPAPTLTTNIPIALRELATFDTGRVAITVT